MAYRYSYQVIVLFAGVIFLFARITPLSVAAATQTEELEIPGMAVGYVRNLDKYPADSTLEESIRDLIDDHASYAMGWVVFPFADALIDAEGTVPTAVSHGEAWVGFQATTVLIPKRELGVVVLANKNDPDYYNLGWNISLLTLGLEPRNYPTADFATR